ncbi:proclotting enzyme [Ixodes scapularis]|uniref:proclotting enzyme n=1 Tax=Ixodes scapularis TaxID=6945 RepID=UPI001A9F6F9B|nr:proclotting enzyme [Ixodes scapularis]
MEFYTLIFAVVLVHQGVAQQSNKSCGITDRITSIIVGSQTSTAADWPWLAAIYLQESGKEKKVICGGALISPRYIITTAQCVAGSRGTPRPVGLFSVRLGDVDLRSTDGDTHAIDVDVETIHRHPRYNGRTYNNNVALLELSKEVPFSQFVRPICLPLGEISMMNVTGIQAFVVGWEHSPTNAYERSRNQLQVGLVTIWEDAECQEVYRSFAIDQKTQLCAGDQRSGPGPCPISVGGPLLHRLDGRYYLLGLASFGYPCGYTTHPDIYTRITGHLDWIQGILN